MKRVGPSKHGQVTGTMKSSRDTVRENPSTKGPLTGTYQTRVSEYASSDRATGDGALQAYAELYGRVQRKLFAETLGERPPASLKSAYLRRYRIPARMFNSIRVSLEGKTSGVQESMKLRKATLERQITRAEQQISQATKKERWFRVHQTKRRLANIQNRLAGLETDIAEGRVRLCFGSKSLWRKQHQLQQNGYDSHEQWLVDWKQSRNGEFFVMGSRDERAGCQLCVATVSEDGSLTLRLRMPDALSEEYGKYLVVQGVQFAYGHEQVLAALLSNAKGSAGPGQPISYRFKRDAKGWRVFVSTEMVQVPVVTDSRLGVIGVDLNVDHLAVAETDPSGNCLNAFRVPLVTYGKSSPPS